MGVPDARGDVTMTLLHQEICTLMGSCLATMLGVDEDVSTPPRDDLARMGFWKAATSNVDDEGCWKVPSTQGQRIIPSMIKVPPAIVTTPTKRQNSFVVLGASQGEESPVPSTNRTLPDGACGVPPPTPLSLQAFVHTSFQTIFGDTSALGSMDTPLCIKSLFDKGTGVVDCMIKEINNDHNHHWSWLDKQLIEMKGQLDLTIASLQKQAASIQLLCGNIDNLLAATKKNTSAIAAQENRLLQVEETITACKDMRQMLDNVRHHQLNNIRGDIAMVKDGVHWLEEKFMEGLDNVNIRVDGVIKQNKMTPPGTIPPQTPPPMDDEDLSRANMVPDLFVLGSGPPDGDLGVSQGQQPSYGLSVDARVEASERQSGYNTAHSPQTPLFSSTFASEGDRAMGE